MLIHLHIIYDSYHTSKVDVNSYSKDHVAYKGKTIYQLALYKKCFPNSYLVEKANISTNKFLCTMADGLSTVPSIYY